ncbi:hypothetical protein C8Q75DRAFT_726446 [Abortiporus biennis]|nr:hypothetical protein C8Q75DRAFT_726446 [Abortiporus biennis]
MPSRESRDAPSFKPEDLLTLGCYFEDLEQLFIKHAVTGAADKICYARHYAPVKGSEIWGLVPELEKPEAQCTYEEFKKEVNALYPGGSGKRKYMIANLDHLTGEYSRVGIHTASELVDFYRNFILITKFLIQKSHLSTTEQARAFERGLGVDLLAKVCSRLSIILPNHHPDDPYSLKELHDASTFLLSGTTSSFFTLSTPSVDASSPGEPTIKQEQLSSIIETITKSFTQMLTPTLTALQNQAQHAAGSSQASGINRPNGCLYCGQFGHSITRCVQVEEDIRAGKCRRAEDGKVILPNGSFVPRIIPGNTMCECIHE